MHIGNLAGVAYKLARAQRELGYQSIVMETYRNPFEFPNDIENCYEGNMIRILVRMIRTVLYSRKYDVIHVHGGISKRRLDIPIIKRLFGKTIVVHFHGSESRMGYGLFHESIIDGKIVSTPDLKMYHPDAKYIPNPQPINGEYTTGPKTTIIHMPTSRDKKGTEIVIEAIQELKKGSGFEFEFVLVENESHQDAISKLKSADILIGQITHGEGDEILGLLGMSSLEAMSFGKVVVTSIHPEYKNYYEQSPVISVAPDKDELVTALSDLLSNQDRIPEVGRKGIEYIRTHHHPREIARRHIEFYEEMIN